jgi:hypothetical protein
MIRLPGVWPKYKTALTEFGTKWMERFCLDNDIPIPDVVVVPKEKWHVSACAYYRPITGLEGDGCFPIPKGIVICPDKCGFPCGIEPSRNWTWPGSTTDREPFGVIAHELGHHCDWHAGKEKGTYWSDYGACVKTMSGEKPISGYCPNPAEWFAEMFRVFVTNPALLRAVRPVTYAILLQRWRPIGPKNWKKALGRNVPPRIVKVLQNKGAV